MNGRSTATASIEDECQSFEERRFPGVVLADDDVQSRSEIDACIAKAAIVLDSDVGHEHNTIPLEQIAKIGYMDARTFPWSPLIVNNNRMPGA